MDKLQEIHDDIKEIKKDINEIKITDAVQTQQLGEHMRRTEASEKRITKMEQFKWYFGGLAVIITFALELLRRF